MTSLDQTKRVVEVPAGSFLGFTARRSGVMPPGKNSLALGDMFCERTTSPSPQPSPSGRGSFIVNMCICECCDASDFNNDDITTIAMVSPLLLGEG